MKRIGWSVPHLLVVILLGSVLLQGCAATPPAVTTIAPEHPEAVAAACSAANREVAPYFATIAAATPELRAAVTRFPKGADIHNHISGTVMPEDYIAFGTRDGDCYGTAKDDPARLALKAYAGTPGRCSAGDRPLAQLTAADRQALIASLSMDGYPYPDIQGGHDQFFATFGRFGPVSGDNGNKGAMLAKLLQQANADAVSYVETMMSFQGAAVGNLANILRGRFPNPAQFNDPANYRLMLAFLHHAGLDQAVAAAGDEISTYSAGAQAALACGTPAADPACSVGYRFLSEVNRNSKGPGGKPDLAMIFTQTAFSFALAAGDPRVVGVNLVSGEDLPVSMESFGTQMGFFSFCHATFPQVTFALHGGEITPCFVGAQNPALYQHIAGSLATGASRLGHGISFAYLSPAQQVAIVRQFRTNNALVEVPFTSNAQILGVAGAGHPFPAYFRQYGVPTAFATDDEGVSYANFTDEWLYAILEYQLSYDELKTLARNSLQYSFLPGKPLWSNTAAAKLAAPCAGQTPGAPLPAGSACASFLQTSLKAQAQWHYETRLAAFDRNDGPAFRHALSQPGGPQPSTAALARNR